MRTLVLNLQSILLCIRNFINRSRKMEQIRPIYYHKPHIMIMIQDNLLLEIVFTDKK